MWFSILYFAQPMFAERGTMNYDVFKCVTIFHYSSHQHQTSKKFLKAQKKIQIYLALALGQFPPKWKPHNIRTSNPVEEKYNWQKVSRKKTRMNIFDFLPVLLSCGHLVQLMAATFRRDTKMFDDDKTFSPWKNHKSIPDKKLFEGNWR